MAGRADRGGVDLGGEEEGRAVGSELGEERREVVHRLIIGEVNGVRVS